MYPHPRWTAPQPRISRFDANQRHEIRHPVHEPAVLKVGAAGCDVYLVTILDVSAGGLRISGPMRLPRGTRVEVCYSGINLPGEVRYVREVEPGDVHVGIQVIADQDEQ